MSGARVHPVVLTVAGFDPTGGAGVLADCRTFALHGVEGVAAIAAMTVQDGKNVHRVDAVDPGLIEKTLAHLVAHSSFAAAKTGLLPNAKAVAIVARLVPRNIPLVVDPVLASSDGFSFLDKAGQRALIESLFPIATLVTPNLHEAEALTGEKDPARAARALFSMGAKAVLIKGGHAEGPEAVDTLFEVSGTREWSLPRHQGKSMHGTGCILSAAIAAGLAKGLALPTAIEMAKAHVHRLIAQA